MTLFFFSLSRLYLLREPCIQSLLLHCFCISCGMQNYTHAYHYTATQHLIVHVNLYITSTAMLLHLHTGAPQASESLTCIWNQIALKRTQLGLVWHFWFIGIGCSQTKIHLTRFTHILWLKAIRNSQVSGVNRRKSVNLQPEANVNHSDSHTPWN